MMKFSSLVIFTLVVVLLGSAGQLVLADSTQVSNTVSLSHLSVKLAYPSEVQPSQSITINIQATARDSFRLKSLEVQVYFADGKSLRQLTIATVSKDLYMSKGDQDNEDAQVTVPAEEQGPGLIVLVSGTATMTYY